MEFQICQIGCGSMATSGHGPSLQKYSRLHHDAVLAGCCDLRAEAAEKFRDTFGFARAYTDYRQMIDSERPDVVLVVTPVTRTKTIAVDVLRRGCNILLEKPPGLCRGEALAIHQAAVENGVSARVAFNRRYMPLMQALREEMERCGEPLHGIQCHFVRVGRTDEDFSTTAIHQIDAVRHLARSSYRRVHFDYLDFDFNGTAVTSFWMNAVFSNGAAAQIAFLPCGGCIAERLSVTMTGHSFFLELPVWGGTDAPGRLTCLSGGRLVKTVSGSELVPEYTLFESNGFYQESAGFFDALRAGRTPGSDVADGVEAVEIADAMRNRLTDYTPLG